MPTTTWDPANKNAAITLSGSNLIATSAAGSGTVNAGVIGTTTISGGVKQYFEVTVTGTVGQYLSIGVMNGSASLSANIGANNGVALVSNLSAGTRAYLNGSITGASGVAAFSSGQVIRVAVDRGSNRIWWAINNNIWSGSSVWMGDGTLGADPATGTGGLLFSAVTGTIYPAMSSAWTGDVATINGGSSAFAYTIPTGFVSLDTAPPPVSAQATQVAVEHWATVTGTGLRAVVTQAAVEHWATVASVPVGGQVQAMVLA